MTSAGIRISEVWTVHGHCKSQEGWPQTLSFSHTHKRPDLPVVRKGIKNTWVAHHGPNITHSLRSWDTLSATSNTNVLTSLYSSCLSAHRHTHITMPSVHTLQIAPNLAETQIPFHVRFTIDFTLDTIHKLHLLHPHMHTPTLHPICSLSSPLPPYTHPSYLFSKFPSWSSCILFFFLVSWYIYSFSSHLWRAVTWKQLVHRCEHVLNKNDSKAICRTHLIMLKYVHLPNVSPRLPVCPFFFL